MLWVKAIRGSLRGQRDVRPEEVQPTLMVYTMAYTDG